MSFARIALATAGIAGAVVVVAAARPAPTSANAAEKYFGCPTGYQFQTSGSNARCYVAGTTQTADIFCGVGYVKALDQFNGGRDACQHKLTNVVGNYTCPSGYSPKVQAGPDVCTRTGNASIMAPYVERWL